MRSRPFRFNWATGVAWLFLLFALAVEIRTGLRVWGSDLAGTDDPAHYTTGVMVFEYAKHGLFQNPLTFAQSFYRRFPKVALGHWPPVYYVVQAAMFTVSGPSIESDRVLSFLICAALAAVIYLRTQRIHGTAIGALCAACFLMLPLVQANSWLVMSDILVGLFMLLAAMSFADFLDTNRTRDMAYFGGFCVLAILTKGSGWALGIFAILAPLLSRRFGCFRNKWYWIFGVLIGLVSAPFFLMAKKLQVGYPVDAQLLLSSAVSLTTRVKLLSAALHVCPPAIMLIVCGGMLAQWRKCTIAEIAALTLIFSQIAFLAVLPLTEETRYYIPSAAALILLFGRGLRLSGRRVGPLLLATACFVICGVMTVGRVDGYRSAVDSIAYRKEAIVILLGSDASGEGAFIAERLEHDRARAGMILRGSKVLASSNWAGDGYRLHFRDAREVLTYLHSAGVEFVVIDHAAVPNEHTRLLEAAVRSDPEAYSLAGQYSVTGNRTGEVLVFHSKTEF